MTGIVAGKVAIVTGAGRGIGRGIALLLAQEGARVVVCDIGASLEGAGTDAGPADEVVDEIKRNGGEAIASALVGNFGQANYMAAKFGIVGLSRGIALDMQRFNVRSNCIAPFAWTRMIDSIPAQTPEEKARVERFQQMTPEKIAPLTVYLAS